MTAGAPADATAGAVAGRWNAAHTHPRAAMDRVDVWSVPTGIETSSALRELLGRYLGLPADQVFLRAGANGKPVLDARHAADLRFNLAHSDGRALVAVRLGHDVGVDLERIRPGVDCNAIAEAVFPPSVLALWRAGRGAGSAAGFFTVWVRFEALVKATGHGIAACDPLREAGCMTCRHLPEIEGFAAAVASSGEDWELACWSTSALAGSAEPR